MKKLLSLQHLNFLGHIALARDSADSRVGNFLGDFVKGRPESFKNDFSSEVYDGILMHRAVDAYTDSHRAFKKAQKLLAPVRQRYAGIVVDIIYDYFLSLGWQRWVQKDREEYIQNYYTELSNFLKNDNNTIPPLFCEVSKRMIQQDWLSSYATKSGLKTTFQRVSMRTKKLACTKDTLDDLEQNYSAFEECFEEFLPDVIEFTTIWKRDHLLS